MAAWSTVAGVAPELTVAIVTIGLFFLAAALVFGLVLRTTPFGRSIYAMGGKPIMLPGRHVINLGTLAAILDDAFVREARRAAAEVGRVVDPRLREAEDDVRSPHGRQPLFK